MTPEFEKLYKDFKKKLTKLAGTPQTLELRPETLEEAVYRADFNREIMDMATEAVQTAFFYIAFRENGDIKEIRFSPNFRNMIRPDDYDPSQGSFAEMASLLHPDDYDLGVTAFLTAFFGKGNFKVRIRLKTRQDKYDWFENTGICRTYPNGKTRIFFGTYINITNEVNENKDVMGRLEAMIGGVKGGLVVTRLDIGFPYEYVSEAAAALQGYTPEELIEVNKGIVTNNIHPDDIGRISEEVTDKLNAKQDVLHMSYRVRHKDGQLIWVDDFGKLTYMPDGSVKVYSLIQDITEQVVTSNRLAQERAQYREALGRNAMTTFVFDVTDAMLYEDILLENGESVVEQLGLTLPVDMHVLAKKYVEECQIKLDRKDKAWLFSLSGLTQLYKEGKTGEIGEFFDTSMGSYIRAQALLFTDIVTGHIMCRYICTDITDEKKAEENRRNALLRAIKEAEAANKAKTIFMSNMSHDIRTPMNAIMGYTTLAKSHIDDRDKTLDYLEKIQTSGNHLLQLINDVLDMSRIESGTIVLEESKIDIVDNLTNLLNIALPGAREKKINVNFDTDIQNRDLYVDQLRLNQVLINCLGNAVKFTPQGGKITLYAVQKKCKKPGYGIYEFHVKDTGIGIAEEYLKHIFEPFSRERSSTVSGIQGTGLGMAISKNIVDLMGGDINVKSKKGEGTEIIIKLHLRLADESENHQHTEEKVYTGAPGVKILLVEDNAINREIATEILKEGGAIVTSANDGSDALEIVKTLKSGDIDLILMDMQMPVMSGLEATKAIRQLPDEYQRSIPIVAMTANAFEEDKRAALAAGMNAHLTKPIVVAELWKTINMMI